MGWERKRGKLHELNELLRGSTTTGILHERPGVVDPAERRSIRGHARRRHAPPVRCRVPVGRHDRTPAESTVASTLPVGRVTEGYGILQPRITPTLPAEHSGSLYQRIFSGPAGVDPYASAVSDVYQDLFQEGSYTGKGIYDVDAFRAALADRVPENALLSHDLFEGVFARAGLATDIELFDEFPADYLVADQSAASVGPRRLAAAAMARRPRP